MNRTTMHTAVVTSKSKSDLELLLRIAKKLGMKARVLSSKEFKEIGLANSITRENKRIS